MFANQSISRSVSVLFNVVLILSLLIGAVAFPIKVHAAGGTTTRASIDSNSNQASGDSWDAVVSVDGNVVAFRSTAANLVPGDTNNATDTFVHNRQTGMTERVSVDSSGNQANMGSYGSYIRPAISADGRFVTFSTDANNLVLGDTNANWDVFVRDRQLGITERISVDSSGNQANNGSFNSSLSADGRYVAFRSYATNLVPGDTNGAEDVFVHDRQSGLTERVSLDSNGNQGNASSLFQFPAISSDGRFIIFISMASNLVSGDTNNNRDVFLRDRQNGTTIRVNVDSNGVEANGSGNWAAISEDGKFAAFSSSANNLVASDMNGQDDIFVRDVLAGTTERISVDSNGNASNNYSYAPNISADGRFVFFTSYASNLVSNDTNGQSDIFIHDRMTGTTERVSVDSNGIPANSFSYESAINADGQIVVFTSAANNLVTGDTNGQQDVFVHELNPLPVPSTRYVSPTGTDTGNCGNSAGPCATITYAISQAVAGNTIEIAAGTYTEVGITVNKDLTITGAGASNTIVQQATSPSLAYDRVFFINSGVTVTIDGMTIQNGYNSSVGGGIYNLGMLTVNNSTIRNNFASYAGGGLSSQLGTLTMNNSTISSNVTTQFGGGLYAQDSVILNNVTISDNSAGNQGGGIYNNTAALTLNNSTVSNNSARNQGGGLNSNGTLNLNYSTVAYNTSDSDNNGIGFGGGIFVSGTANIKNSIVAGNSNGAGGTSDASADCPEFGSLISQGYNLTGSGTGCNLSGAGDVTVTPANVFTDVLGILADNGGATQTHALIVNSSNPALNAIPGGTNDCGIAPFDVDQRGAARPFDTGCDIGAYEAQSAPPANNPVPTLSSINPTSARAGDPDEILTVIGTGFAPDAVVRWHGATTTDLATTYVSASELSAVVPAALLAAPGTFEVSVFNPAPGGGSSSSLPFFVTQSAATVISSDTATSANPTGTAVASTGGSGAGTPGSVTASATGSGTVTVAIYDSNPRSDSPFRVSTGGFFDVYVAQGSNFSSLIIVACNMPGFARIRWLDGGTWRLVNPQSYSNGCITMNLSSTSSPTMVQLTGTIFGVEGFEFNGFLSPVDNPDVVNIGKAGRTYPIKWQLKDGDDLFLSDLSAVTSITYKSTSCGAFTGDPTDSLEVEATGGTSLRYDSTTNQFIYNWKTPGVGCFTLFVKFNTGQVFYAYFNLR